MKAPVQAQAIAATPGLARRRWNNATPGTAEQRERWLPKLKQIGETP
jgi:hypothetical protein